jgi:type I restriction enzyme, S subunit
MSFPRYPQYKDSGVEWLGEVPKGWGIKRIKSFTRFSGGSTPSREKPEYWNGEIAWVSPKDMKSERILGAEECITEEGLAASSGSLVPAGRLLMVVRSGILQHTIPVAINVVSVAVNQDIKVFEFNRTQCLPDFFFRWVQGFNHELLLAWAKQGATVESIEHAFLANSSIPLPSIEEQHGIVRFLDQETAKIDALIEEQRRLIELLKEKRRAVASHAVAKGLDPGIATKDSCVEWIGDVPEHWTIVRVADLFRESREQGCDSLPILSVSIHHGVSDRELDHDDLERTVNRSEDTSKYKRVYPGDLTYNMMRAWQGAFGAVLVDGMVSPAYVVARPLPIANARYFESALRTPSAIREMKRFSKGVTDFRLRLYWEEFKNIRVPAPPAEEQAAIIRRLDSLETTTSKLTEEAERSIALLQERRSALISAAVTGKIDVRKYKPQPLAIAKELYEPA